MPRNGYYYSGANHYDIQHALRMIRPTLTVSDNHVCWHLYWE